MGERRAQKRIPINQRCWCERQDVTLFGRITNASPQGAFIRTAAPLQQGDKARLVWNSPNGKKTVIRAEVVWVSDGGSGTEPGLGLRLLHFEAGEDLWLALLEDGSANDLENDTL